jgi:hypothetical protein
MYEHKQAGQPSFPLPKQGVLGDDEIGGVRTVMPVKAEIGKNFSICPQVLINAELYGLVLAPRLKKKG